MGKLIPLLLALSGLGIGVGAGWFLRPAVEPGVTTDENSESPAAETAHGSSETTPDKHGASETKAVSAAESDAAPEYVKLSNQFVIPVLKGGKVTSMVILALSLEVAPESSDAVYGREPKLRDAFLQVMFDHANAGGFEGSFTDGSNLILLRKALLEAAKSTLGDLVKDILISDIARQDS